MTCLRVCSDDHLTYLKPLQVTSDYSCTPMLTWSMCFRANYQSMQPPSSHVSYQSVVLRPSSPQGLHEPLHGDHGTLKLVEHSLLLLLLWGRLTVWPNCAIHSTVSSLHNDVIKDISWAITSKDKYIVWLNELSRFSRLSEDGRFISVLEWNSMDWRWL
jgi:hypothetical protein